MMWLQILSVFMFSIMSKTLREFPDAVVIKTIETTTLAELAALLKDWPNDPESYLERCEKFFLAIKLTVYWTI